MAFWAMPARRKIGNRRQRGCIRCRGHAITGRMNSPGYFELFATDGQARTGRLTTPHGMVRTPAFMPVGTSGAMKGMHWRDVRDAGSDIVLGNTYHLILRPGAERIAALGGLQGFTGSSGPRPAGASRLPVSAAA